MLWGIYSAIYGEVNLAVEKCVEIKGDYVEKQQIYFISVTLKSSSGQKLLVPNTYVRDDQVCGTAAIWMWLLYRVILSVLDPRKCEYLKDYSLDF